MPFSNIMEVNGISSVQQIIASSTGAMLTSLITTPLDVVKVRLQSQVKGVQQEVCGVCYTAYFDHVCACGTQAGDIRHMSRSRRIIPAPRFNGLVDTLLKVSRQEGFTSLWAGLSPTLVMTVPGTVLYFTTYEQLKQRMQRTKHRDKAIVPILAGAVARICAVSLISPIELIRTKAQSEKLSYRYIGKAVAVTVKQEGILSLWRGWGPTVLRDVPFSCIYWGCYESFKKTLLLRNRTNELSFVWAFTCGAAAGTIAGVATLPFDVVKTHRQIELGQLLSAARKSKEMPKSANTLELMLKLYREKGVASLFSGVSPRIAKVAPSCAIMISSYEFFKGYFRRRNNAGKIDEAPVGVKSGDNRWSDPAQHSTTSESPGV